MFSTDRNLFFAANTADYFDWYSVDENIRTAIVILFLIGAIRTIILYAFVTTVFFFFLPGLPCLLSASIRKRVLHFITAKAAHRFFSFNCNCPCYRPRPKLRFVVQLVFLVIICCIRLVTIILCVSTTYHVVSANLAVITALTFFFLVLTSLLDYYHYRVWWNYKPDLTEKNIETPNTPLSKKHIRYLPYELLGDHRTGKVGDKLCPAEPCKNRQLEHILIFHLDHHQPQPRWSVLKELDPTADVYIGFHRTKAESAILISHSDFRRSTNPPQMLGFGIYFARSIQNTLGKARFGGAIIAAEIRMGKVKEVTKNELRTVSNTDSWHPEFDTIYYSHENDTRDEFCVYDETQILRWIVVIDEEFDSKIKTFGMANEFKDTKCFCI